MTVLVVQFAACGSDGPTGTTQAVARVLVTPAAATLVSLGQTLQLTARARDAAGNTIPGKTFTWSSSDESIATVTDAGLVTALANGPAVTITAATDGVEGTAAIKVGTSPSARGFHSMAYDAESDRVVLFGGERGGAAYDDTWAYDFNTNTWTEMNPATSPGRRGFHAMAYDAQSDRVILFGGGGGDDLGDDLSDTWAYDFNTNSWTEMNPTSSPAGRQDYGMVYDTRSDRIILFGGLSDWMGPNQTTYDDTWAYDFDTNAWTQLSPSPKPLRESCLALAYDAESDRVILFGFHQRHATWAYDFKTNAWTDMNPERGPQVQAYHAMAYDAGSDSDRVILFGGTGADETWAYDFNSNEWTNMRSVDHPSGRWGHRMAYDEESNRVVLFGGEGDFPAPPVADDTWAYDFNTNTWTHMQ